MSRAGGFRPGTECSQVDAAGHCALSVHPAGMIHGGLIELSNIDIPVKTVRVYVVMVPRAFVHYSTPDSILLSPVPAPFFEFSPLFARINSFLPSLTSLVDVF